MRVCHSKKQKFDRIASGKDWPIYLPSCGTECLSIYTNENERDWAVIDSNSDYNFPEETEL